MSSSRISAKGKSPTESVIGFRRHEPGTQPDSFYPAYRATQLRAPSQPLIFLPHTLSEVTGPVFGHSDIHPNDRDLTVQHAGEPLGERIIVSGRVVDGDGHAVSNSLIEILARRMRRDDMRTRKTTTRHRSIRTSPGREGPLPITTDFTVL